MLLLTLTVLAHAPAPPALAAECSIDEATNGTTYTIIGGRQNSISNLEGTSGDLWNYNPAPVWDGSLFWVMAGTTSATRWAQIGWWKQGSDSLERVFLQYTEDDGDPITRWYHSNDTWTSSSSGAVNPTSSKKYEVYKYSGTWYFRYDSNAQFTEATDWDPDDVLIMGETFTYDAVSGGDDKGDHFPGHNEEASPNHLQANNGKKNVSGTWSNTSLSTTGSDGNGDTDLNNNDGDGTTVWDVRCGS